MRPRPAHVARSWRGGQKRPVVSTSLVSDSRNVLRITARGENSRERTTRVCISRINLSTAVGAEIDAPPYAPPALLIELLAAHFADLCTWSRRQ